MLAIPSNEKISVNLLYNVRVSLNMLALPQDTEKAQNFS